MNRRNVAALRFALATLLPRADAAELDRLARGLAERGVVDPAALTAADQEMVAAAAERDVPAMLAGIGRGLI